MPPVSAWRRALLSALLVGAAMLLSRPAQAQQPGLTGTPGAVFFSTSDVTWTWSPATGATSYKIVLATETATQIGTVSGTTFTHAGLDFNVLSAVSVQGSNGSGDGPLTNSPSRFSLANAPDGLGVTNVTATDARLSWNGNGNPGGTTFEIQKSTDDVFFAPHSTTTAPNFDLTGLTPLTTYYFKVRAYNNDVTPTAFTAVLSTRTTAVLPGLPGTPSGVTLSTAEVSWSWTAASNATGYNVYYSTDPSQLLAAVGPAAFFHGNLPANAFSGIIVAGTSPAGEGPGSNPAGKHTFARDPAALQIDNITSIYAALSWSANGNSAGTTYDVQRSTDDALFVTFSTFSIAKATVTGLSPSTSYYFRVRAFSNDSIPTAYTASLSTLTNLTGGVPPPGGTGNPNPTVLSTADVSWSWNAASDAEYYEIYLAESPEVVFTTQTATTYVQGGLPSNSQAGIAVRPVNATSNGPKSSVVTVYTFARIPDNVAAVEVHLASASLTWGANGNLDGTTYELAHSTDDSIYRSFSTYTVLAADVDNLAVGTTYYFRVRARNVDYVPTEFSAALATRTLVVEPGMPGTPSALTLSTAAVAWSWSTGTFATGYKVTLATKPAELLALVSTPAFVHAELLPNGLSGIVVRSVNGAGESALSADALKHTFAMPAAALTVRNVTSIYAALTWDANGNSPGTPFEVQKSSDDVLYTSHDVYSVTVATISGLMPLTTYYFKVRSFNNDFVPTAFTAAASTVTDASGGVPPPGVPGTPAPTVLSTGGVSWTWSAAADATSYLLYRASQTGELLASTPTAAVTFTDLEGNALSGLVVRGLNDTDLGPVSPSATAFTLAGVPGALSDVDLTTGSVTVSWGSGGNRSGTRFELQTSTDGTAFTSYSTYTVTVATVSGLNPGTSYYFKVRARNDDAIDSAFTAVLSTKSSDLAPGAPGTPSPTVLSSVSLSWSWSPAVNAASYEVFLASKTSELLAAPGSPALTLSGLRPNGLSAIVVRGVNGGGTGPLSASATAFTFAAVPSTPAVDNITSIFAALSWSANSNTAGTSFTLQRSTDGSLFATYSTYTVTVATATGLSPSTSYYFRVRAANGDGVDSAFSGVLSTLTAASGGIPPPGVPGTPTTTFLSTADVSWTWTAASDASSYEVFLASKTGELIAAPVGTAFNRSGLSANAPSGIVVRGVNATDNGPLSPPATAYTLAQVPGTPGVLGVSSASVSLVWGANGNPALTTYELHKSTDGAGFIVYSTYTLTSALVSGLAASTSQYFKLKARNEDAALTSFSVTASTLTNPAAPGQPGPPAAVALSTGDVRWTWAGGTDSTSYELFLASSTSELRAVAATNTVTLSGFDPNTPSGVVVRGLNVTGAGALSAPATAYSLALAPATLSVPGVSSASASLAWSANGNPAGTFFEVFQSTDDAQYTAYSTYTAVAATVDGLAAAASHYFKVRSLNGDLVAAGFSNTASTLTFPPPPGAPGTPAALALSTADVSWSWNPAVHAVSYEVYLASKTSELLAAPSTNAVTLQGLTPNGLTGIVVRAVNASGPGPLSASATSYSLAMEPASLAVVAVSSSVIDLSWSANGNSAGTTFRLEKSTDGVLFAAFSTYTAVSASAAGLPPDATQHFRLLALNGDAIASGFSNTASTRTLAPLPGTPGTPVGTALSTSQISWSWSAATFAVSYQVYLASDTSELIAVPSTETFVLAGLSTNSLAGIVVRGVNANGAGPLSPSATAYTLAQPPASLAVVSVGSAALSLSWSANTDPAGTVFALERGIDGGAFSAYSTYTAVSAVVPHLQASTTYDFQVRAFNGDGVPTAYTTTVTTRTHPPLPGIPGTPGAVVLSTADVSWSWTGASDASSYEVYLATEPGELRAATTTNAAAFGGLTPNAPSAILVRALNVTGAGPLSGAATAYTFAMPPAASAVTAVSSTSASLAWSANGSPGGTVFELQKSSDDALFTAYSTYTATSASVDGLAADTSFYFRVRARNQDLVDTAFDATVSTLTNPPLPGLPGTPIGTALSTADVSWSWTAAPDAQSYQVTLASETSELLASPLTNSFTLSGLGPNGLAGIVVRAFNPTGAGPLSGSATAYSLAMPPASLVTAAVTATSADVAWASAGNPAGTTYQVQKASDGVTFSHVSNTLSLAATVLGLSSSTAYDFKVRALNGDAVASAFSNTSSTATNGDGGLPLPGTPGTPVLTALSTGSIVWTWSAAAGATGYRVFPASSPTTVLASPATERFSLAGLGPNTPSAIVVLGANGVGYGPLSGSATAYSLALPPTTLGVVSVDSTSAVLSWNANSNPAGTVFELQKATDGASFTAVATTTLASLNAPGLSTATAYDFRVRARNADDVATVFSNTASTATPTSLPGIPGSPAPLVLSSGAVSWSWTAAARATSYQVYLASKTSELLASPAANSVTLNGFSPNALSGIVVRGVNADGAGPLSASATAYTFAMPPSGLATVSVTATSADIAWTANGNPAGTDYQVQKSTDGVTFSPVSNTGALSASVSGLSSATAYDFRVRAQNGDLVLTAFSNTTSTQTNGTGGQPLPGVPGTPALSSLSTGSVVWTWTPAANAASYKVVPASSPTTVLAAPTTERFGLSALGPNTPSAIAVLGVNAVGDGPLSGSATVYSLALPPTGLAVTGVSSGSASVSWDDNGNPAGTVYEVQKATDGTAFTTLTTTTALGASASGLTTGTSQYFKVRAANGDAVDTAFSATVSTLTHPPLPGTPGTPVGVALSTGDVSWSWTAASDAQGYQVYRASKTAELLASPPTNSFTLAGLDPNGLSGIVVRAFNPTGAGPLSAAATAYSLALPPAALVTVSVTATSADIAWGANGNAAETVYEIEKATDGVSFDPVGNTTSLGASVSALSSSTAYDFRVRARNGDDVASAFSNTASTQTNGVGGSPLPGMPGTPALTAVSTGSLVWTWSAASDATSYKVFPASSPTTVLAAPATERFSLAGLGPNTPSGLVVSGLNAVGDGPLSGPATAYSLAAAPSGLAVVSVTSASAALAWSANGNPAGTIFELQRSDDDVLFTTYSTYTAANAAVGGLSAGTTQYFRVRARNGDAVATAFDLTASTMTHPALPGVPGTPAGVAQSTADVSWSWASAADAQGYEVYRASKTSELLAAPLTNAVVLSGLGPNGLSGIVVRAFNQTGAGSLSAAATTYSLALPPSALAFTSVSSGTASLAWSAAGNPAGTVFELQKSTDNVLFAAHSTFTAAAAALSGLAPTTTYYARVRAFNADAFATAFSATAATITLPGPPLTPGTPIGTALSSGDVSWSWTPAGGAASYEVFLASKASELIASPAAASFTRSGLLPNGLSGLVVRGVNVTGPGPLSASATAYTLALAPASLVTVAVTATSADLSWSGSGNSAGTVYQIQKATSGGAFAHVSNTTALEATVLALSSSTAYDFRVLALNGDALATGFSNLSSTATNGDGGLPLPGVPGAPALTELSTGSIVWTWSAASDAASYRVFPASSPTTVLASPATERFSLSGLGPNTPSGIVVLGANGVGYGPLSGSATAYSLAAAPAVLAVVSVDTTSAALSWSANANPDGTVFELEKATDGVSFAAVATTTALSLSAPGLSTSTAYGFRVRARNGDDVASAFSNTAATTTLTSLPGVPGTPAPSVLSTGAVSWTWTAGSLSASYQVFLASDTAELLAAPAANSVTLNGFSPNALSGIVVRGVNPDGVGPLSPSATAYTFAMPPAALSFVTVSSDAAVLSWAAAGNPAGTVFELQQSTDGGTFNAHSTTTAVGATFGGLLPTTSYYAQVRALNGDSVASAFSASASTFTRPGPPTLPGQPSAVVLSTGDIAWTWTGATAAASYQVFLASKTSELIASPSTNTVTLSGLTPNGLSAIVVRGVNVTGNGPLSASATAYTFAAAPAALAFTAVSSGSASLSWNASGNPAGTVFELQKSTDNSVFTTHSTYTAVSAALSDLVPTTTYYTRVRAANAAAVDTAFSNTASTITLPGPPTTPGVPAAVPQSTGDVSWSWTPAGSATSYEVFLGSKTSELLAAPTAASVTLSGYAPNGLSGIVVRGVNVTGAGALSASATAYTLAAVPASLVTVSVTATSIDLSWGSDGNSAGTVYQLQKATDGVSFAPISNTVSLNASVSALSSSTAYDFRVRAQNGGLLFSAFSNVSSTQTNGVGGTPLPGAAGTPSPSVVSSTTVDWSWSAAPDAASYKVYLTTSPTTVIAAPAGTSISLSGYGPNTPSSIFVAGTNAVGDGPLSAAATAYTFAQAPTALVDTAIDSGSVSMAWSIDANDPSTLYAIDYSPGDTILFSALSTTTGSAFAAGGLSSAAAYGFRVYALNGNLVATAYSNTLSTRTLGSLPPAPNAPSAVVLSTADVRWSWNTVPLATSYKVSPASNPAIILAIVSTTNVTLTGNTPNAISAIAVRGSNGLGDGPLSQAATAYTLAMAPSALSLMSVTSSVIYATWSANGSPVGTVFELQKATDGVSFAAHSTFTVTSASASGLSPSTAYDFRVRARNADGAVTAFANTISTTTRPPVPGVPGTPLAVVLSTADLTWSWTPAGDATSYEVYLATKTSELLRALATDNFTLSGLGVNEPSAIVVRGVNPTAAGALSPPATAYTFAMPPLTLALVSVSSSDVSLSWSANGNPPGTVFELQKATDGVLFTAHAATTAAAAIASGLIPSTTYDFRIRALNGDAVATGFANTVSTATRPPPTGVPGTPAAVVLSTADVSWSWAAAPSATAYEVYLATKTSELLRALATNFFTLSGLGINEPSAIVVRGVNPTGAGALSPAATAYTFAMPPATLALVSVSSSDISLSWNASGNPSGTVFELQKATDGVLFAAHSTFTAAAAAVAELFASASYDFRVRARNEDGVVTAFTSVVSTTTRPPAPGVPGTPAAVVLSTAEVSWSWTAAASATGYEVYLATATSELLIVLDTNTFTHAGLVPNERSAIVVRGVNPTGAGSLSPSATAYTFAMPPAALALISVSSSAVGLSWSANGSPAGTVFELQKATDGVLFTTHSTYTLTVATVSGLGASSAYDFRVRAANGDALVTAFANVVSTTTRPPAAGTPGTPAAVVLSTSDVSWSWTAALSATGYEVYLATKTSELLLVLGTNTFIHAGLGPNEPSAIVVRGVNPTGAGSLSPSATAYTFAMPPATLTLISVSSAAVGLSWSANGSPAGTVFELQKATDGVLFTTHSTYTLTVATASDLAAASAYDFRVRALNGDAVATTFANVVSTTTRPPAPGAPAAPSGFALGVSSVQWTLSAAVDATSYEVYPASAPGTVIALTAVLSFTQTGLSPNTTASILTAGVNPTGAGAQSSSATPVYTLAQVPTGTAVAAVYATSATLSWGLNGNPAGTQAELQKSSDTVLFSQVALTTGVSRTATGLLVCSSYTFRVRNFNGDGFATGFDADIDLLTLASTPSAPGSLRAEPLAGNRIALSWDPSPSESVTAYRLYWDAGSSSTSYAAPLAVVPASVTAFTTGVLASSAAYRFALRAFNRCGIEEANTGVAASAPSLASLTGVRAAVAVPQAGKRIKGNRVTIVAELTLGDAAQTRSVLFQYRPSSAAAWLDLPAANPENPNPDLSAPFFVHWDVDALGLAADQAFDLRAVASDLQSSSDAAPSASGITVVPAGSLAYDIAEGLVGGKVQKAQTVDNAVTNTLETGGGATGLVTRVQLPAGALSDDNATLTVVSDPAGAPAPPAGAEGIGVVSEVTLSNAQTLLSNGRTAALTLGYADADGNGIIDGTTIRADRLVMYSAQTGAGPWVRDFASSVDTVNRTVTGNTPHFSFFALFAAATSNLDTVRVYPVPYMPNGGNPDEGAPYSPANPNSGIIFDNLPVSVTIKIYTVTGQRVAQFGTDAGTGKIQWDVKNDRGQDVASGGYVAVITSPTGNPVVKRILIIR
ncbi:MAG: fibronectin type III domain-containing protein [Elusimicrobia bacterium]|nr:fibronectin type III domain-containing protein [Elusimicrobiota bacterium]